MSLKTLFRTKSIGYILQDAQKGNEESHVLGLKRTLKVRDLTAFGIAAIIGAGIFATIGKAAHDGGPAISMLFVFTAVACAFSALCYAEFASMLPISGSAYTYAYVSFGELIAWIIGWDLILEYAIGNIAVAISWSDYFTGFLANLNIPAIGLHGIHLPDWITMDYLSAWRGYSSAMAEMAKGTALNSLDTFSQSAWHAWQTAPAIGNFRVILDIPALAIVGVITWLVFIGIKESRNASNAMVLLKLIVILLVIVVGAFYVNTGNWSPFAPEGFSGVMKGVSAVFFAFIGFDAISTTAEECENPQRDLPRSIIYSLIICTILYVAIALVLTGMVHYKDIPNEEPVAFVFQHIGKGLGWMSSIVSVSAIFAMASVLLVFQMGQPRIWMSMSRDGLLPKRFSKIHPKYQTPSFATIVTGLLVAIPALFMNLTEITDLSSIGTLFAFVLVCGGVLIIEKSPNAIHRKFKVAYINGKWVIPAMFTVAIFSLWKWLPETFDAFFVNISIDSFWVNISTYIFLFVSMILMIATFRYNLSLIPALGLLTCFYLMTQLDYTNWLRFGIWLLIGMVVYFGYSRKRSKLAKEIEQHI